MNLGPERPFTGVSGPSGPEIPKKSRKESFWGGSAKSPRKYPKKPKNTGKSLISGIFRRLLCRPTPKKTLFETFLEDFGWLLRSQILVINFRCCSCVCARAHYISKPCLATKGVGASKAARMMQHFGGGGVEGGHQ